MKRALSVIALLLTTACMGGGTGPGTNSMEVQSIEAVSAAPDRSFQGMLNDVRAVNGAGPVSYNGLLYNAAKGHADDMFENNYFSHVSLDGRRLRDRVNATGYEWRRIGENIGRGQDDEAEILVDWINSPDHQANNVDPLFEHFALAKTGSGSRQYWVLVLGDPL